MADQGWQERMQAAEQRAKSAEARARRAERRLDRQGRALGTLKNALLAYLRGKDPAEARLFLRALRGLGS